MGQYVLPGCDGQGCGGHVAFADWQHRDGWSLHGCWFGGQLLRGPRALTVVANPSALRCLAATVLWRIVGST